MSWKLDRDAAARILERVAMDGLPGPRDMEVALDALEALLPDTSQARNITVLLDGGYREVTLTEVANIVKRGGELELQDAAGDPIAEFPKGGWHGWMVALDLEPEPEEELAEEDPLEGLAQEIEAEAGDQAEPMLTAAE